MKNIRWHLDEGGGGSNLNPRLRLFSVCGRRRWEQRPEPSKWNNLQILTFGGNLRGRERDVEAKNVELRCWDLCAQQLHFGK